MSDHINIGFGLEKVTTENFFITEEAYNPESSTQIKIDFRCATGSQGSLSIYFGISFYQENIPFLKLETGCHFTITKSTWTAFVLEENNKLKLPEDFVKHLLTLCIGTSRGVLHAKTERSNLNHILLPVININDLIEDDVILMI